MPSVLAFIDEPAPKERHREAVPDGATFAQARIPAVDAEAKVIYIGTPDPDSDINAHRDWAEVKRKYEAERDDPEGSVGRDLEINVVPEMDPDMRGSAPQDRLSDVVGTRQARALNEAGYGTLEAAQALSEEELTEIDGVGKATYEKLHS